MKETITPQNCHALSMDVNLDGHKESQAACWKIVYNYCIQQGAQLAGVSGIETVIHFIDGLITQNENLRDER